MCFSASEVSVWIISRPNNNSSLCYHCTQLVFTYSTGSSVIFEWNLDFLHKFRKIFKQPNPWKSLQWKPNCSMRSDRHDEADSPFSQFWERTEIIPINIPDKTRGQPLPNTLHDSVEFVPFCNHIYQLPLQWPYIINRIEQSGFGGLEVTCWPLVPKFAEVVGFLRAKKCSARLPRRGNKAVVPMS
jgi:hypothetical protein